MLAFWPHLGILLLIEVKTDLAGVESTLRKLDEKVRLAPAVAHERFGWEVSHVAWLLVFSESSTLRRRVGRHEAVFARVAPMRGAAVRHWLKSPAGGTAGLMFLPSSQGVTHIQKQGGPQRVRTAKRQSCSHETA